MYKVLVIEDEDIIRKGLINSINWTEHECRIVGEAKNGLDGLKKIASLKPDLILLDVNMPIMDGIEMLSKLTEALISTIIISGYSEFEYAKQAIKYNVVDYLLKPIDSNDLIKALEKAKQQIQMRASYKVDDDPYRILHTQSVDSITLNKAIKYIEDNIGKKILMKDISDVTNKSPSSLNNRFQREMNLTFNEYLIRVRIQKAIDYIKDVDEPLYKIAQMVGYQDYKYFNRVFHKITGVSPKIVQLYYMRNKKTG